MNPYEQIPHELQRMIDSELSRGERVAWSAQPLPGRFARKAMPAVLFGIPCVSGGQDGMQSGRLKMDRVF